MPVIPSGFAQVNLKFTGTNTPTGAEVTFGVNYLDGLTPLQVAEAVDGAVGDSSIMSPCASQTALTTISVKFGPNATGPSVDLTTSHTGANGDSETPNVTWLIKKSTALGGRAGRGRMYWPGVVEEETGVDGVIIPSDVTAFQTAADLFFDELAANDVPMVLLHGEGSPISEPTLVTALTVDPRVATQRRRLRR